MPKTIQVAILLLWGAFLVGVVSSIFRSVSNQAATGALQFGFFGFFFILIFLFNFFMTKLMMQKRNIVRFVITILFACGVVQILRNIAEVGVALGILQILLELGVIVSLFLPSSNEWFRKRIEVIS